MIRPLVSILIPAYNAERWIATSLTSAVAQDWPRKEIVVVDDGSADRTYALASRFASSSVKIVRQDRGGASAARNSALRLAQGDYIQWLDADDLLAPDKISQQMRMISSDADPLLVHTAQFVEFFDDPRCNTCTPSALWQDFRPIEFLLTKFTTHAFMHPAAWLVSRQLTAAAGHWDEQLSLDDDGEYFSRVVARSKGVRHVPEARTFYRRSVPGSLSRQYSKKAARSAFRSFRSSAHCVLSLEDCPRTRAAALGRLQAVLDFSPNFQWRDEPLQSEIHALATALGGEITIPRRKWTHRLAESILGHENGMRLLNLWYTTRLRVADVKRRAPGKSERRGRREAKQ